MKRGLVIVFSVVLAAEAQQADPAARGQISVTVKGEDGSILGGQCGILPGKIIRRGQIVWGTPARSLTRFKEQYGWMAKLPELAQRLSALEAAAGQPRRGGESG